MQLQPPQSQRWSTDEVDPRRALAYWVDTVCDRFLELEIDTPLRERFRAQLEQAQLGAATLNIIGADTQRIQRTQAKIAHSRYPAFFLLQLREGRMRLRQRDQEAFLRAGESVLIAWPQIVGMIASAIVLFVIGYVIFQRQEVRA